MDIQNGRTYGSSTQNGIDTSDQKHSVNGSTTAGESSNGGPSGPGDLNGKSKSILPDGSSSGNVNEPSGPRDREGQPLSGRRRRLAFLVEMILVFALYLPYALLAPFFTTKVRNV